MEKIRVQSGCDLASAIQSVVSEVDPGRRFSTYDVRTRIIADFRQVKYRSGIAPVLKNMNCLQDAGSEDRASAFIKLDDPRLHKREITHKNLIPGMCSGCVYSRTFCEMLFKAQEMAGVL